MVSPVTKKADLGGIDTPPSANYLVVHNPAKCSVFWRSTQGHGEISFPFGNHPPPHPLFSLRSQTATSQLAGFRNECQWISMNINECQWISMNINECQWISMNVIEYQWISMNVNEYQWISMKVNEYQWISMNVNEYQWMSMNINEYQWM